MHPTSPENRFLGSVESPFLAVWHDAMIIAAIFFFALGVLLYFIHRFRVSSIANYHDRYDFINTREIGWYKLVFHSFGLGIAAIINLYGAGKVTEMGVWFFVRIFISVAGGTLVGYIAALVLEYWYPSKLNAKLNKLRYTPRVNPATGNKMRLLSESEEDVHLDAGRQAEENIFSMDYDVWVDEKTNDVVIEKYQGHLTALRCGNCGFHTMRVAREEISEVNEDGSPKEIVKHYQCSYCKSVRATAFAVSTKELDDYKSFKPVFKNAASNIELVKIEIHSSTEGKKFFEFQTVEQAQKFLSEYDVDKVA
jgi:hypothetical protein